MDHYLNFYLLNLIYCRCNFYLLNLIYCRWSNKSNLYSNKYLNKKKKRERGGRRKKRCIKKIYRYVIIFFTHWKEEYLCWSQEFWNTWPPKKKAKDKPNARKKPARWRFLYISRNVHEWMDGWMSEWVSWWVSLNEFCVREW